RQGAKPNTGQAAQQELAGTRMSSVWFHGKASLISDRSSRMILIGRPSVVWNSWSGAMPSFPKEPFLVKPGVGGLSHGTTCPLNSGSAGTVVAGPSAAWSRDPGRELVRVEISKRRKRLISVHP